MLTVTIGNLFVSDRVNYGEKLYSDPNLKNSVNQINSLSLTKWEAQFLDYVYYNINVALYVLQNSFLSYGPHTSLVKDQPCSMDEETGLEKSGFSDPRAL